MNTRTYPVKKGERLTLNIESMAFGGRGVAKVDGYTIFVDGSLPGQTVEATLIRRKKRFGEARLETVAAQSPAYVDPRCEHFGVCGGCRLQHFDYEAQLKSKQDHVLDCVHRIGGLEDVRVSPTLPAPSQFEYRNKMEFSFSPTRWLLDQEIEEQGVFGDRFGLGLHVKGRFNRVVNIERCHLQSHDTSRILGLVRNWTRESGLQPYSTKSRQGFWRFLTIRESRATGDRMVMIMTTPCVPGSPEQRAITALADHLVDRGPNITSLIHGQSGKPASIAVPETTTVLHGASLMQEELFGLRFNVGPNTFFQTNTEQAHHLFEEAISRAEISPGDVVWDLYCGVGALTLPLAQKAERVIGAEIVEEAVVAARVNAGLNGIENAAFVSGDLKHLLAEGRRGEFPKPTVIAVDPPRDGMHPRVVEAIIAASPRRIVYVSCNPASLARDLSLLHLGGYHAESVHPVDMFPHTPHIECVTSLGRK